MSLDQIVFPCINRAYGPLTVQDHAEVIRLANVTSRYLVLRVALILSLFISVSIPSVPSVFGFLLIPLLRISGPTPTRPHAPTYRSTQGTLIHSSAPRRLELELYGHVFRL